MNAIDFKIQTEKLGAKTDKNSRQAKPQKSALEKLLQLEGDALQADNRLSLKHQAVNNPRNLINTGHIFFLTRTHKKFHFEAISSQASVEKNAPLLQILQAKLRSHLRTDKMTTTQSFDLSQYEPAQSDYPYPYALYAPFSPRPDEGGLLFTRANPWSEGEYLIPERLAKLYGALWLALTTKKSRRITRKKKTLMGLTGLTLALIACLPIPMTSLAPAEIVAADPIIVSAPMDGVISHIHVLPNQMVRKGDILAQLDDTQYRNEYSIAQEELAVATARLRQASLSSFIDNQSKRELAIAQAEQKLSASRQNYAADLLDKTFLRAPTDGLLIYSDVKDWIGRPVATGERIMDIANPQDIELRLETPIHDNAVLTSMAKIKLFLDHDPLNPIAGTLTRSSYYAQPQTNGHLAYEAYASLRPLNDDRLPRIGARGVAKIYGEKAPLGYWLARRPITAIRQFIGL